MRKPELTRRRSALEAPIRGESNRIQRQADELTGRDAGRPRNPASPVPGGNNKKVENCQVDHPTLTRGSLAFRGRRKAATIETPDAVEACIPLVIKPSEITQSVSQPAANQSRIETYSYPFDLSAIARWRQWVYDDPNIMHGMDPDFLLPFLATTDCAKHALLVMEVTNDCCDFVFVVVPERSVIRSRNCWRLFTHPHIDANGLIVNDSRYSRDLLFDLLHTGLSSRGILLSKLFVSKMQHLNAGKIRCVQKNLASNATFDFSDTDCYEIPGRLKRNNRRLAKKLAEELGTVRLDVAPANRINTALFFDIEASGWKGREQSSIKLNAELHSAYSAIAKNKKSLGRAHIFSLYAGEKAVASAYGLIYPDRISLIKIGFIEEFGRFSPGSLLISEILEHCCDVGKNNLCFNTFPAWAKRWEPRLIEKYDFALYGDDLIGRQLYIVEKSLAFIKSQVKKLLRREPNQ